MCDVAAQSHIWKQRRVAAGLTTSGKDCMNSSVLNQHIIKIALAVGFMCFINDA